jgi:hypothetical protein
VRRFTRTLRKLATALSLALCIAAIGLVLRARHASDTLGYAGWYDQPAQLWQGCGLRSQRGHILLYYFRSTFRFDNPANVSGVDATTMQPHFFLQATSAVSPPTNSGFRAERLQTLAPGATRPSIDVRVFAAPHWSLIVLFAVAPLATATAAIRRRLHRKRPAPRGFEVEAVTQNGGNP